MTLAQAIGHAERQAIHTGYEQIAYRPIASNNGERRLLARWLTPYAVSTPGTAKLSWDRYEVVARFSPDSLKMHVR